MGCQNVEFPNVKPDGTQTSPLGFEAVTVHSLPSVPIGIFTVHGVFHQKSACVSDGIVTVSKLVTRMGRD